MDIGVNFVQNRKPDLTESSSHNLQNIILTPVPTFFISKNPVENSRTRKKGVYNDHNFSFARSTENTRLVQVVCFIAETSETGNGQTLKLKKKQTERGFQ